MKMIKMLLLALILVTITAALSGECRLMMMVARNKNNETCDFTSYTQVFNHLRAQSNDNEDGWGVAYFEPLSNTTGEGTVWDSPDNTYLSNRYASYKPAHDDTQYYDVRDELRDKPTQLIVGHVRNATSGSASIANPHPFVFTAWGRSYVFAHNGSADTHFDTNKDNMSDYIDDKITVDGWNEDKWGPWRDHDVDSGVYFGFIMAHIKQNNWDILRGLREALTHPFVNNNNWTARNFVFSDGYDAYAFRSYVNNPNSYTLEYMLSDSSTPASNATAYIMSELPSITYFNNNKVQIDNNELVYIPHRGRHVHFKDFNSNFRIRHVKTPYPPFGVTGQYYTWDSFPVIEVDYDTLTAIQIITQDYSGGSGNGFGRATRVINQANDYIIRDNWWFGWTVGDEALTGIEPQNGYQILHQEDDPQGTAFISGEIIPHDTVYQLIKGHDNWVGYWLLNSQTFINALGDNYQHVSLMEARDWYYSYKFPIPWPGWSMEFGQMYNIKLKSTAPDSINFTWNNSREPVVFSLPPRAELEFFTYEHGTEYQVIDIEYIEDGDDIKEVGVFADGVCIGAATTDFYPVQILIYPDGYEGLELEFQYYDGNRSASVGRHTSEIYNSETQAYSQGTLRAGDRKHTIVRLSSKPQATQAEFKPIELGFYPNPANPDVTISLSLPEMRDLEITLYNIRGQQVKQLAKGEYEAGNYRFSWNGTNDNGQPVSSGIYFCRVKAGSETLTGKIMLLK